MRNRFEKQLETLNNELIQMGAMIECAIASSTKVLSGEIEEGAKLSIADDEIDHKEREIERLCMRLLLQQQPVARDLRLISAALKMITDMERIGDQAEDIAHISQYVDFTKMPCIEQINQMARATVKMVSESIDAFVKKDLKLVQAVIEYDDVVDDLFSEIKNILIENIAKDKDCGEQAVDIIMIAKYFERIGDHAVNIAEWVEYSITGEHKKEK